MSPQRRPPWSEFRRALDRIGFHPSRRLGQNFLVDDNLAAAIAADSGLQPDEFALEIGPGCGFLTWHLSELAERVLAVEIDGRLVEVAGQLLAGREQVELLHADALAGKHALDPGLLERLPAEGPWRMVANLPYSAGTPILVLVSRLPHPPVGMTVLVQREVAERLVAAPGTRAWGPVTVRVRARYDARLGRAAAPGLFWPRPKIESAVVHLDLRDPSAPPPAQLERLDRLVSTLFQQRRKSLVPLLARALERGGEARGTGRSLALEVCADHGLEPLWRSQDLTLEALLALTVEPRLERLWGGPRPGGGEPAPR